MRKVLLLLLTMLSAVFCTNAQDLDGAYSDIYLRGAVNNWLDDYLPANPETVPEIWKGFTEDGAVYVWDWSENPQQIVNEFKLADANWGTHNYGAATLDDANVTLGEPKSISYNGWNFTVPLDAEWTISKITLDLNAQTVLFEGKSYERVYDPEHDYGVKLRFDWEYGGANGGSDAVYDMVFEGNGVYALRNFEYTKALSACSFKIADANFSDINFGSNTNGTTVYPDNYVEYALPLERSGNVGVGFPDMIPGTVVDIIVEIRDFSTATVQMAMVSEPQVDVYILPYEGEGEGEFAEDLKCTSYANGVYMWDWSASPKELPASFHLADMDFSYATHGVVPPSEGEPETLLVPEMSISVVPGGNAIRTRGTITASQVVFDCYSGFITVYGETSDPLPEMPEALYLVGDVSGGGVSDAFKSTSISEGLYGVSYRWMLDEPIDLSGEFVFQSQDGSFKYSSDYPIWTFSEPVFLSSSLLDGDFAENYPCKSYGSYKVDYIEVFIQRDFSSASFSMNIAEVTEPYYFDLYVYGSCTGWQFDEAFKASADGNGVYTWTWPEETPFSLSGAFLFGQNGWWQQYNVTMDSEPLFIPAGESETQITLNFNNTVQGKDIPVTGTILVTEMVLDAKTNQLTVKGKLDESKPLIPDFYIRGFEMNNELNGYINEEAIPGKWRGTPNEDYSVYTWDWTGLPEEDRMLYGNFEIADMGWLNRFSAVPGLSVEFLEANKPYDIAIGDGSFRIPVSPDYEITVSTITMNLDDMTLYVDGELQYVNLVTATAFQTEGEESITVDYSATYLNKKPASELEDIYCRAVAYTLDGEYANEAIMKEESSGTFRIPGWEDETLQPGTYNVEVIWSTGYWDEELNSWIDMQITKYMIYDVEVKEIQDPPVSITEQEAVSVYSLNGTVYADMPFILVDLAGRDVTKLNGNLKGLYIIQFENGNHEKILVE